jgi:AMP deaminase
MNNFRFEDCEMPPVAQGAEFALNDEGVFEVYVDHDQLEVPIDGLPASSNASKASGSKGKQKIQHVPSLKEYFTDLDFLLGVCSDGPAKSFAFRRLKYLASKWSLYCLLNEYQELADMKVSYLACTIWMCG